MKKLFGLLLVSAIACSAFAQDSTTKMQDSSMTKMNHKQKDAVMMKDSVMMLMRYGMTMKMDSSFKLNNGAIVMTNGTIKMADGNSTMLKEGQCIDIDGKMWMMKKKMMKDGM